VRFFCQVIVSEAKTIASGGIAGKKAHLQVGFVVLILTPRECTLNEADAE
jgi:hypothetical protein